MITENPPQTSGPPKSVDEREALVRLLKATRGIIQEITGESATDCSYLDGMNLEQLRALDQAEGEFFQDMQDMTG